jgi:hypothetical protein
MRVPESRHAIDRRNEGNGGHGTHTGHGHQFSRALSSSCARLATCVSNSAICVFSGARSSSTLFMYYAKQNRPATLADTLRMAARKL